MRKITQIVAILSIALIASECLAQGPERRRPGDGQRKPGADGQRRPGQGGNPGQGRDPAQMIARMMQQFDKDGDKKLDLQELTALFKAMRERRGGQGGPGAGRPGAGRPGAGRPGAGRPGAGGRRGGVQPGAGGQRPMRPGQPGDQRGPGGPDGAKRRGGGNEAVNAGGVAPQRPFAAADAAL